MDSLGSPGQHEGNAAICDFATGFLPLHATIAVGTTEMVDYLTRVETRCPVPMLPFALRADPRARVVKCRGSLANLGSLTPLQLAVQVRSTTG